MTRATPSRPALWAAIATALTAEIGDGLYRPGDKLPTEAELAMRFGVNRHTVRRALSALAEAGTVHPRRGSGVYVTTLPTDYPLSRRVRFHQNVLSAGQTPSRRFTRAETCPAPAQDADRLGLAPGSSIHLVEGVSLADRHPLAVFRSVFPADRFPGLLEALSREGSVTAALSACGLADYTRAETRLTAKLADPVLALTLQIKAGAPVLRSEAVNVDRDGQPIEHGTTWFAGDRVTLTVAPD